MLVVEITLVSQHIIQLMLKYTLGFMSFVPVYTHTEVCKADEKGMFYAKSYSVLDQWLCWETFIVLGSLNAASSTKRGGYELCVGSHGFGTRNTNSSLLLNFAQFRKLRIAGSWY